MPKSPAPSAASPRKPSLRGQYKADTIRLKAVLDTIQDATISINADGIIKWANNATEAVFGWRPDELKGKNIALLISGVESATHNEYIRRYLITGDSRIVGKRRQVTALHRDGLAIIIELSVTETQIDGEPIFVAVARDLTSALKQRSELAVIAGEIEAVLNVSPSGIALFSQDGRLRHVNKVFMDLMDYQQIPEGCSVDILDQRAAELATQKGSCQPVAQLLPAGNDILIFETPRHLVLRRSVKSLPGGGIVIFLQDSTETYDVDRMKTEFLSSAAHELRTPMASIHGFSELMLKREYNAEARREMVETIHRQSSAMVNLVNELLDLARIEARAGKDFRIRPCDLSVLLASVSAEFEAQRSILVDVAPDVPKVWADADKLRLVIVNLLSNAVKYSPAGGPVEVSVHLGTQNYVEILVEDRGIGMTPDQIEHIFDRFYRVDPNSTVTGSGLGMALVKEIIDIHQGVVSVTPRPGGGLRVRVSLLTVAEESVIRMAEDKIIDNSEK
jgi:PAS domain S-box-containing protein